MTSVVMTGRRMKIAERFTRRSSRVGGRRAFGAVSPLIVTGAPGASRSWPSVTTVSPGCERPRDEDRERLPVPRRR